MVWDVSFTCDICGRKKLEANHWWMLVLGDVPCFDEGQPTRRKAAILTSITSADRAAPCRPWSAL
jgi:hypothetical protein